MLGVRIAKRKIVNDPTQFEQVDETCEFGGAVLYSESLGITAFFENVVPSKYETQKLKQLQFGIENEKIRQFEHECLIQYRKRYLLEICQNASFLSTPDKKEDMTYGHVFLFGFRPLCGLHPLEFQCSGEVNSSCAVLPSRFPARLPKA